MSSWKQLLQFLFLKKQLKNYLFREHLNDSSWKQKQNNALIFPYYPPVLAFIVLYNGWKLV